MKKSLKSIELKRNKIDVIDHKILKLLTKRAEQVEKISLIKKNNSLAIYDKNREKEIINRLNKLNEGPLSIEEIKKIYNSIFKVFRRRQIISK